MFKRDSGTRSVEERLSRLEHENRKLKMLAVAPLLLVVVGISMGMAAQSGNYRYLEANTFVLKDSAGHIRGQWTSQGTSSGFTLNDDHEQPVMELLNAPEYHATKLSLIGPKGGVSLWATNDDASLIVKESNYPQAPNRVFLGIRNAPTLSLLTLNKTAGMNKVILHGSDGGGFGTILDDKDVPVWAGVKNKPDTK